MTVLRLPIDPLRVPTEATGRAVLLDGVVTAHASARPRTGARASAPLRRGADRVAALRAARRAVAALCGAEPLSVSLLCRTAAPPVVVLARAGVRPVRVPCALSVAHSAGRAVAAAAPVGRRIGIDLERADRVTPGELRLFADRTERSSGVDPTTLWLLKEAVWKALVCPPSTPFHALRLELGRAGELCSVRLHRRRFAAAARVWSPWRGWIAAVVAVQAWGYA